MRLHPVAGEHEAGNRRARLGALLLRAWHRTGNSHWNAMHTRMQHTGACHFRRKLGDLLHGGPDDFIIVLPMRPMAVDDVAGNDGWPALPAAPDLAEIIKVVVEACGG